MKLDTIDLKILKVLQQNSKITNIELSKKIGLSAAPTLGRVQKLEKQGFISSYHAKVNKSKVGHGFMALVQVSMLRQSSGAVQNFLDKVMEIEEIIECLQLTGNFDYQLRIVVSDIPAFDRIIAQKLGSIEEIGQMQTTVVLSTKKNSPVMPLDYTKGLKID